MENIRFVLLKVRLSGRNKENVPVNIQGDLDERFSKRLGKLFLCVHEIILKNIVIKVGVVFEGFLLKL